jgi:hypothetical protein
MNPLLLEKLRKKSAAYIIDVETLVEQETRLQPPSGEKVVRKEAQGVILPDYRAAMLQALDDERENVINTPPKNAEVLTACLSTIENVRRRVMKAGKQ